MNETICILGRQPQLGIVELESLFGSDSLVPIGEQAVLLHHDSADVPFARLGGTIKLCKVLTELDFTDWGKLQAYLVEHVPKHTCCYGPGKLTFGISAYGFNVKPQAINATALEVKKAVRATDRPVRVVPNKSPELNSAQVLHNRMTNLPLGMELVLVRDGASTWLAQTVQVQDIEAYAARDQARPKRDARVGMLPPKLAQIIINLAKPEPGATVLDPFCGTGVVLQEASLMGNGVYGSDLEQRMVEYSSANLEWLNITSVDKRIEQGDATNHNWSGPFSCIAAETYLGRPFSAEPKPETLREVMQDVDTIHRKFLKNIAKQTKSGFRMCIAIPAWKTRSGFKHLKTLDSLEELGYNRVSFVHSKARPLIYHRENQVVGRELVTLIRK